MTSSRWVAAMVAGALLLAGLVPAGADEEDLAPSLPGVLEGTGTAFAVTDSEYLNVTLQSTVELTMQLESIPSTVLMSFQPVEEGGAAWLTLGALAPSTTYYKYEDSYENLVVIASDEAGRCAWQQDLSAPHVVWIQPRPSTKFLRDDATGGDCASIGLWDPSTKTCILAGDVSESIQIDADGITLDGAGFTVQGAGTGSGVYIPSRIAVTIKDLRVTNFTYGVKIWGGRSHTLQDITADSNTYGIDLSNTNENVVQDCLADHNGSLGVYFSMGCRNLLFNSVISNGGGVLVYDQCRFSGNTLSGNTVFNSAYGLWMQGSSNLVTGNSFSNHAQVGIGLGGGSNNTLTGNTVSYSATGIYLQDSNSNTVYHNRLLSNNPYQARTARAYGNLFSLPPPTGGNFWSDWTAPDDNADGFVDLPYSFIGGYDALPWATDEGWIPRDADGDGVLDAGDNCPATANADQADLDSDGQGDACDVDLDGDGVPNVSDNCAAVSNPEQIDTDSDGEGDACDLDDDGDGIADGTDNCPFSANAAQVDLDADGEGDACDVDLDGDGHDNAADNCPETPNPDQYDTDADAAGDACDEDDDNDGLCDALGMGTACVGGPDNCPTVVNPDQADLDGDGIGNLCDADLDGDGIDNAADNCLGFPNPAQDDTDADGMGDACDADDDADSILDGSDNCPLIPNAGQQDLDADGRGDACDTDLDGDSVANAVDNCPTVANSAQADLDDDGLGDACDADIDGDGVPNGTDLCAATPSGAIVDAGNGCSIVQLCPCAGPRGTNQPWKNHGQYVSCVAHAAAGFFELGLITEPEKDAIVSEAGGSSCGQK